MTDIVEWLRNPSGDIFPRCREAADEIERLTAQNKELRDAMLQCARIFETAARAALEPKP